MAGTTFGDEKAEARKHFDAGNALLRMDNFKGAAAEFALSIQLYPTKNATFNLANCYKAIYQYGKALAVLDQLESTFGATMNPAMQAAAREMRNDILAVVATLNIRVNVEGADVMLDGTKAGQSPIEQPLLIGPGRHSITVTLDGYERQEAEIVAASGSEIEQVFELKKTTITQEMDIKTDQPKIDYPMNPYKKWGHVTFWTGLGFVAFGAVSTGLANKYGDDFNEDKHVEDADKSNTWSALMWVGYGMGAALMITGATLWALSPGDEAWAKKHDLAIAPMYDGKNLTLAIQGTF
jgi:tetratricopeptide (TPR) repeat protein